MVRSIAAELAKYESLRPQWKLVFASQATDGSSIREYESETPLPGWVAHLRIEENARGFFGTYRITR